MFDTVSVFDAMEMDNTQKRVASRRALALAHNRVERNLGSFLRGARSEADFEERLSLLQDEFAGYVTASSAEVGHEHPEHIAKALRDHYRLAAKAVEFTETPAEKQEEEEEDEPKTSRWGNVKVLSGPVNPMLEQQNPLQQQPQGAPMAPGQAPGAPGAPPVPGAPQVPGQPGAQPGVPGEELGGFGDELGGALGMGQPSPHPMSPQYRQQARQPGPWTSAVHESFEPLQSLEDRGSFGQRPNLAPPVPGASHDIQILCPQCGGHFDGFQCRDCGYDGYGGHGQQPQPPAQQPQQPQQGGMPMNEGGPAESGAQWAKTLFSSNPAEQRDTSPDAVTCPECGGDGKTANSGKCAKCAGKGKVRNFGDSAVDTYGADIKTSADGNTGLDGPEPKMNKSQGPGSMPDVPGDIEVKDVVEPIKATNEGSLSGIGDIKTESLPSEKDNAGFQSGGEDSGPHTKTFGDGGQANPVTHETFSATNPLSEILTSEFPPDQVVNEALLSLHE